MSTQTSVWVVIAADGAADKLRQLVDSGNFAEAKKIDSDIKSISEKIKQLVQEKGGSLLISTYDRQVLDLPATVAEEMPLILSGYKNSFGSLIAAGIGLNLREASIAAKKSAFTGHIELFDPQDESFKEITKTENLQLEDIIWEPNVFDRTHPKSPKPEENQKEQAQNLKYVPGPNAQQAMQLEAQMLQATIEQLNGPANQVQQQMMQQQQQPQDLLEALNGGPVPNRERPADQAQRKQAQAEGQQQEEQAQEDSQESDDNDKLGSMLSMVQEKIPQLMNLAESNPETFKKVVGVVHKLLDLARTKKKNSTNKSEVIDLAEELNKTFRIRYPVGTTKGRKKKVVINGKEVWRSMASGQVRDSQGQPISVRASNAESDDQEGRNE